MYFSFDLLAGILSILIDIFHTLRTLWGGGGVGGGGGRGRGLINGQNL